jgi:hypothetical protein
MYLVILENLEVFFVKSVRKTALLSIIRKTAYTVDQSCSKEHNQTISRERKGVMGDESEQIPGINVGFTACL